MRRRLLALCVVATFVPAASASANTLQATCSDFGTQLIAAGANDTIVLTGLCSAAQAHYTLPSTPNLTIEGAASGINGFDGTGVGAPALASPVGGTNGLTVRNLNFRNYASTSAVRVTTSNATDITSQFAFTGDTFLANTGTTFFGGGLDVELWTFSPHSCTAAVPTLTLSGSTFTNNGAKAGGGGAVLTLECPTGSPTINLTNNNFNGNVVFPLAGASAFGGGLMLGTTGHISNAVPINLSQSGNVFDGNGISGTGGNYEGGGEFTIGANMSSTSDRFTNNNLSGSTASTAHRIGGGLSSRSGGNCTSPSGATSQADNLVAAGNTIGAPTGTGIAGEGAGIYVGCTYGTGGYNLTLRNSTVSGNQATGSGAVAGVDGETTDFATLRNTILFGNSGGADLAGFGASSGANVTATNSDVCAIGGTVPFAGPGNICADPLLVSPGPGVPDVHETAASPTIDAGDNAFALTPADVFGNPRILVGRTGDAAIVDIGAAEFGPAPAPPTPPDNSFAVGKVKGKTLLVTVHSPGTVEVVQAGGSGRLATASAKKKLLKRSKGSGGPGTIKVKLKLTKKGNKTLKKKAKLKIKSKVTFTPTGGTANSKRATLKLKQ